jgi:hypothetical protein
MRAGQAGAEPYRHPVCRAGDRSGGRRAGTLTCLCPTDACTVHDRRTHTAPVPPTRRGRRRRAVPSPGLPCRRPERRAARRNPDMPVPDRRLYRPRPAYSHGTRTPYAPGAPAQSRTVTQHAVPRRLPAPARRNPDTPVPARQPYRARRAYQRHSRTPYAPGPGAPGEPGRTAGNDEQSAPAVRSVATARRARATDSGSAASYTTPHTTRRPRLAWTNHRRRSAHGTTVTRQSRILTCHLPAQVFGRRAPGAPTPAPT